MTRNFPLPAFTVRFFTFAILGKIFPKLFILYCGLEFINYNWNRYYLSKSNIKKDDEYLCNDKAHHQDQNIAQEKTKARGFEAVLAQEEKTEEIGIDTDPRSLAFSKPPESLPSKKLFVDPVGYLFAPIVSWVTSTKKSLSNKAETLPKLPQDNHSSIVIELERQTSGDSSVDPFVIIDTENSKTNDIFPLGEDSV